MPDALWFIFTMALAIGLGLVNGFNDAANAIATVIGTRVLSPRSAVIMAASLDFIGALFGTQVARTIGNGILVPNAISYETAIAGLLSIVLWGLLATYWGLPISLTHGFVAGLAGAGMAVFGIRAVVWRVMLPIIIAIFAAPLLGFIGGFIIMISLYWLFRRQPPERVQSLFGKLEILSAAFLAYTHGLNDGQNAMAVMVMALVIYSGKTTLWNNIPFWIKALSAISIGFGTALGGWQVIKTMGMKVTALRPIHGFAAEFSAATINGLASLLGIPTSTTHCIAASIMGVGSTRRLSAVRWGVAGHMVAAWIFTFPLCGGLGYFFAYLFRLAF